MPVYRYAPSPSSARTVDYRAELLAAIDDLPPLPLVLDRVIQLLRDSNSSAAQIAAAIEKDVVLSGSVLRCINSAYYGLRSTVSSIRQAVSLLGFSTVRNLTMAFSLRRMVAGPRVPPPHLYSKYSQHSLSCAVLCHFLARQAEVENSEAAFACGLFHDIGKLLILTTFPDLQPKISERFESGAVSWEQAEREFVQMAHSEVSQLVLERWQLPAVMQQAVLYHHRPAEHPVASGRPPLTLAHILHAADLYVNEYGLEILPTRRAPDCSADRAFEEIGMRQKMPEVLEKFQKEYESIRGLF